MKSNLSVAVFFARLRAQNQVKIKFSNEYTQITFIKSRYLDDEWWGFIKVTWIHSLENFIFTWFWARNRAKNTATDKN